MYYIVAEVSVVISIRIPKKLKEKMDKFKEINWSEEIRKFIEDKITQYEINEVLKRIEEHLKEIPKLPPGTIIRWLKSNRESH